MSVPPPSCAPNSTSTGSASRSDRSITAVSKATSEVRSVDSEARAAANTLAYTTDGAIEPDWSTSSTISRCTARLRRPYPMSRSGMTVPSSGR